MKFNAKVTAPGGILSMQIFALLFLLASVLAGPIAPVNRNALANLKTCVSGSCGVPKCYKEGSCFGARPPNHDDWTRCPICTCAGGQGGCVVDTQCLDIQFGRKDDPCGKHDAIQEVAPFITKRDDTTTGPVSPVGNAAGAIDDATADITHGNAKTFPNTFEVLSILEHLSELPPGSPINPNILEDLERASKKIKTQPQAPKRDIVASAGSNGVYSTGPINDDILDGVATDLLGKLEYVAPKKRTESEIGATA